MQIFLRGSKFSGHFDRILPCAMLEANGESDIHEEQLHRILNGQGDKISVDGSKIRAGGMLDMSFHGPHPSVDKQGGAWLNPHLPAQEYLVVMPQASACLRTSSRGTIHPSC